MKAVRVSLAVLVVLGAALRLAYIVQPMRLDESANFLLLASQPLRTITTAYLSNNNHPLHTILVHFATLALGWKPWCIRAPAFVAGTLVIPMTFATFEELFDRPTALLAAALTVFASPLVEYSTDARGYTLEALLTLALVFAAARVLVTGARAWWLATGAVAILGFYTMPTMTFFFAATLLWMLLSAARGDAAVGPRRMTLQLLATGAAVSGVVVLLYLPFVLVSGLQDVVANRFVHALPWSEFRAGLWPNLVAAWESWHRGLPAPLVGALVLGLLLSGAARRFSRFKVSFAAVAFATCLVVTAAQRVLPFQRTWLPLLPIYLGFAAAGWRWLGDRAASAFHGAIGAKLGPAARAALPLLIAGAGSALILMTDAPYQAPGQVTFRDAEPLAVILGGILAGDDEVYVQSDAYFVLEYYFLLRRVPLRYLYRPGKPTHALGRAFVVDAAREYHEFTYAQALGRSNLSSAKAYRLSVVAELPYATLLRVDDPELASAPAP